MVVGVGVFVAVRVGVAVAVRVAVAVAVGVAVGVGVGSLNVAKNEASAFAVTVCCWAPASDQLPKMAVAPPGVCGDGAKSVCTDFRGTLRVKGAVWFVLSTVRLMPVLFDAKDSVTRFGVSVIFCVFVNPPLSVAVRKIS